MDKKLASAFYETAECSFKTAEMLAKSGTYNAPTIMLIQHAAECYFKSMIEAATPDKNIYDLYREINAKEYFDKKKIKKILKLSINH